MVRVVVLWIVATFLVVLVAGQAFDHISDDVSVHRPAPMSRTEVAEQVRARSGRGGPQSSTSEPAGQGSGQGDQQGDGRGDGQGGGQTPASPGTTAGGGPRATTGGSESTPSTGGAGSSGTSSVGAEPGAGVTTDTTEARADGAPRQQPTDPSDEARRQSSGT